MKLAHFSPLPPQQTGIADYCAQLLPALAARAEVDAYAPEPADTPAGFSAVLPLDRFPEKRHDYDAYLYHMGNHPAYHQGIYEALCRYPGVVVLHDVNLHAFFLNQPEPWRYVQAVGYERGLEGVTNAREIRAGRHLAPVTTDILAGRIADLTPGIIVHSPEARRLLMAVSKTPVAQLPLGVSLPERVEARRPELLEAVPAGTTVFASFGYIAPSKRLDVVLQTLASLHDRLPPFRYLLVGEPVDGYDISALIAQLDLQDEVYCTGYVDSPTFVRYLAHTDVGINLRTGPTGGEMSAALLQMMASAQPVLVSDVGAFSELPGGTVWKIAQDEREGDELAQALQQLLVEPALRREIGERARRHVRENHTFDAVAERILDFVQACIAQGPSVI